MGVVGISKGRDGERCEDVRKEWCFFLLRERRFLVGRGAEVGVWVGPRDRLGWTKAADM